MDWSRKVSHRGFPSSHSSSSFSPFTLSNSHSDFNCKGWEEGKKETVVTRASEIPTPRHFHLLSSFLCLLPPAGKSPPPSAHHNQNTTKSQLSPRFRRGLGSLGWVLSAQCWTCRPACIACYCSSSRTIAVGREDFRGSTTRKGIGDRSASRPHPIYPTLLPPIY